MHNKTYKWCKWHKAWVEHDPKGKGDNGFLVIDHLEEYQE